MQWKMADYPRQVRAFLKTALIDCFISVNLCPSVVKPIPNTPKSCSSVIIASGAGFATVQP